ncbi:MAG: gamma-glutamyl-gamma-aminobutyrate hydrolase family protein [Candidatus Undinarchaeales archaeon]|jgi:GMP synthase (glutamine-hydrolysing) A subunit|nr:gamma-glutamyl-gamma-aminobutyrate hydrolase family protein [Candidatus Undinarchaeales archaeon]MDP7493020.1 gamma-glutamyl-gamma-aminobutyrate hydrolase family protein [Candidatus Undinarchaeales archaeon]
MLPVALLQHHPGTVCIEEVRRLLDKRGIPHRTYRADIGELPSNDDVSGLMLCGSDYYLSDIRNEEWVIRELDLLSSANRPVLGICFGHQLVAEAFGGLTAKGKGYSEAVGPTEVEVLEDHPLFKGLPGKILVFEWHEDEVVRVPSGFQVLAQSTDCPVEAMVHKERPIWCVQFHPEVTNLMHEHGADNTHGEIIVNNFTNLVESLSSYG